MSQTTSESGRYTQGFSAAVLKSHSSRTAETVAAYLLPHIKPTDKILDVGCGPGSITITLAPYVPQGSIIGVDYSKEVIDIASKSIPEAQQHNCSFATGDIYQLAFPDNSFDIVHAHQVLIHIPDPVRALKEMRRVCKVGGLIACREGDWDSMMIYPGSQILSKWKGIAAQVFRNAGSEPDAGRRLAHWALDAGFEEDNISYSMGSLTYSGKEAVGWWGESMAKRYSEGEWKGKVLEQGLAGEDDVAEIGEGFLNWSSTPGAIYSIACGQIVCKK